MEPRPNPNLRDASGNVPSRAPLSGKAPSAASPWPRGERRVAGPRTARLQLPRPLGSCARAAMLTRRDGDRGCWGCWGCWGCAAGPRGQHIQPTCPWPDCPLAASGSRRLTNVAATAGAVAAPPHPRPADLPAGPPPGRGSPVPRTCRPGRPSGQTWPQAHEGRRLLAPEWHVWQCPSPPVPPGPALPPPAPH